MNKSLIVGTLIAAIGLSACGGDSNPSPPVVPPPPAVNPTSTSVSDDVRRLSYNVGIAGTDGFIDVAVGANDASVLVNLSTTDNTKAILVTEIRDPSDTVIYAADVDLSNGDIISLDSDFVGIPYGDIGDTAVFLPPTPNLVLMEGNYRFTFVREDSIALREVEVLLKSVPTGQSVDMQIYSANLNIWIAHPDNAFSDAAFTQQLQTDFKDSINRILVTHSLSIDTITISSASAADVALYADLDVENNYGDACRAMLAATGSDELALNLAYVRNLTIPGEGGIAGASATPGAVLDSGATNSCFFVAQSAYIADPASGFTEDMAIQMMAGNMLHEAGHFMSLEHPTEEAGDVFDYLADTPECDAATFDGRDDTLFGVPGIVDGVVTDFECGIEGGAKNFLFYNGVPQFLPFEMSEDQARVLRRHPLFIRSP